MNDFSHHLRALQNHADIVRQQYKRHGPGKVDGSLFDPVDAEVKWLKRFVGEQDDAQGRMALAKTLAESIQTIRDLSHRCACRSEGLCFVTGEAGMIERKDLHAAFDNALAAICTMLDELEPSTKSQ